MYQFFSNLLSQASSHFVTDRARVFTDHTTSGRQILAKYMSEQSEHILQRALQLFHSLPVVFGGRLCMVCGNLPEKRHMFLLLHRSISRSIFRHDLPNHRLQAVVFSNEYFSVV